MPVLTNAINKFDIGGLRDFIDSNSKPYNADVFSKYYCCHLIFACCNT